MKGLICLWSGAIADIPAGWHICDGTDGTPDLRNRFIVGAGDIYAPDDAGGSDTHQHAFTGDGHAHALSAGEQIQFGTTLSAATTSNPAAGTTDLSDSRPQYYALCYIIKL